MDFFRNLNQQLIETTNKIGEDIEKAVNGNVIRIREQVSSDRNRFKENGFNLDLSYITPRIIAMGYPGQDTQFYRNSRMDVRRFLNTYHPNSYLIINLTEKPYDHSFFDNRVQHIGWNDNEAPSLGLLLYAVQAIHSWLSQNETNVVAIHCLAGKGRTGTLIAAYLLTTLMYEGKPEEALQLFARQRSQINQGVSVPSQLRYIYYVNQLVTSQKNVDVVQNPTKLRLNSIMIKPSPTVSAKGGPWKPTIEIFSITRPLDQKLLFSTKNLDTPFGNQNDRFCRVSGDVVMIDTQSLLIEGDVLVKIYHGFSDILSKEIFNVLLDKPSLKIAFHTSFIDNYCLDLNKSMIDEKDGHIKSQNFSDNFTIRFLFSPADQQPVAPPQPQPQPQESYQYQQPFYPQQPVAPQPQQYHYQPQQQQQQYQPQQPTEQPLQPSQQN
ncbi:hypothetical protein DICPUDRAFT_155824 [Dictyostelium purpureum]|uniref:Uncharacterized protein n=1 Tax=Dictyostelium purpureum TaxID=5786 RepID=F0ZUZ8_DICPU|nr:uncharacterized protein DICPUDRAFT_155824 [Dictyostelium purpureum]EGC32238.1 hypothetical protein DICPUDRAFT_155824 [Dictyostelium purpureum]|eukprot:XP_003291236.1 hypothetical protein DICPUDRAFT_155824 [Dictyostelium purpureum]